MGEAEQRLDSRKMHRFTKMYPLWVSNGACTIDFHCFRQEAWFGGHITIHFSVGLRAWLVHVRRFIPNFCQSQTVERCLWMSRGKLARFIWLVLMDKMLPESLDDRVVDYLQRMFWLAHRKMVKYFPFVVTKNTHSLVLSPESSWLRSSVTCSNLHSQNCSGLSVF